MHPALQLLHFTSVINYLSLIIYNCNKLNKMAYTFIMVIELSGVQFGLKSCACFQNRTSAQREFDLKSQV